MTMYLERPSSCANRAAVAALALILAGVAGCDDDPEPPGPMRDGAAGGAGGTAMDAAAGAGGADAAGPRDGAAPDGGTTDGGGADAAPPAAPNVVFAVVRLNADGTRDMSFGTEGITRVPLGPGANGLANPALGSLARDPQNGLVLFGMKRHEMRTDAERVVVRLTPNGQIDTAFGTMGYSTFGIQNINDTARNGIVQSDGKIVSAGYASQPTGVGTQSTNRIVLGRLLSNGMLDTTFGFGGVVNNAPFVPPMPETTPWGMAEAYGVALQSTGMYVTTGYGFQAPAATGATSVDMVSFRYGADGKRDTTWGMNGAAIVNLELPGGNDRGRNLIALPGDRIFIVGTGTVGGTAMAPVEDAMVVMLTANGAPDTTFAPMGYKLHDFMAVDEEFYGVALAPNNNWVVATGYRAGVVNQDDDATLLLQPIGAGGGTEIAKVVALSETAHDRFWAAAFDANNKAYGAGSIQEGNDTQMVVARFNMDGTLDSTFGMGGIVKVNVSMAGTIESARGIVVQADGKVVIAGPAEER